MTIDPTEAAASLQDIATVEHRTRAAVFYGGSQTIFIMWGILVACGYALTEFNPRSAGMIWLAVTIVGTAATAVIIGYRMRTRPRAARDWRIVWGMVALMLFGAAWSYLLGPVVPRPMLYAFQPSLYLLGMILVGIWLGRSFVIIGLVGIALIAIGFTQPEPWLRLWMAVVQSGTLILGGVWLGRIGVSR